MAWSSKPVEFACQRCLQPLVCNSLALTEYESAELTRELLLHQSFKLRTNCLTFFVVLSPNYFEYGRGYHCKCRRF